MIIRERVSAIYYHFTEIKGGEMKVEKVGIEDRVELYREFYQQMVKFGYAPFYIGKMLAYIARAVEYHEE